MVVVAEVLVIIQAMVAVLVVLVAVLVALQNPDQVALVADQLETQVKSPSGEPFGTTLTAFLSLIYIVFGLFLKSVPGPLA